MAASTEENYLYRANFRLCRLCVWSNYDGLGFNLENAKSPPHIIETVESNSPAAAGGLKILDLILAVNNQDVFDADYKTVTQAITNARDINSRIELLVIEKRFYKLLKLRGVSFNSRLARIIEAPTTMPRDYMSFPRYTPRTCEIRLNRTDESFGFEVANANKDIGAFIQEVFPNTPASQTTLHKSDRILEIDDKFVDDETSRSILDKLAKAKKKCSVKLYVVDTNTYKYFQENRIPLASKKFRKSIFAKRQQPPTPVTYQRPNTSESVTKPKPYEDDIRLCTINRANTTDTYGIELNFHKRNQYHSIKIITGRDNRTSNAALAGVKTNDHLIEINGQNIQNIGNEQVKQRIRVIKYPQPLQILVADSAAYDYYKQQNKVIHSGLPSVKKLPPNIIDQLPSLTSSSHQEPCVRDGITITALPVEEPLPGITGLVNSNPTQPKMQIESSQSNRRNYKLYRIPGFAGYGFSVNSNQRGNSHKITQIAPKSPAAQQGLRVGDYILTVNDKNVEKMSPFDFNQFLRTSAQNAETHGNPLLLQVINEDSYQHSAAPDDISTQHNTTEPPSIIPSINGNFIRQSSYYNPIESIDFRNGTRKSSGTQSTPSQNENRIPLTSKEFRKSRFAKQQQPPKSTHINVEDISTEPRIYTARSRKHRQKTPVLSENIYPSKSVLNDTYRRDSTERINKKQQQRLNLDPNDSCRRLKTENSRVLIDTKPVQKLIQNQKVHKNDNNTQIHYTHTDVSIERNRNLYTPVKKENGVVNYSDDWHSDYSDDRELHSREKSKPAVIRRPSLSESKTSNNGINLVPSDPTAFEASFCRKRQEVINNMSYRQAINSWNAKRLHDVVKLIIDLSKGKSLIDRAWIVFYWVSQNIEYDVEAYFSGNIRHQTPEDIFASGKGVCDAFGTIFETLCNAVQIECKKISGYAKGYGCKIGQKSFARTNHAWNVIRLEGHWYLVDPTWGEGFLDTNKSNRKELNPFYFLVRPEQMIYRHLPQDPKWQLLLSPISMDDFVRLPYVHPTFFEHNLDIIYPRYSNTASFNLNLGLAEVLVQASSDTVLMSDIEQTESGKIKNGSLIQYDANHQQWQCLFAPQQGGFHTLTIFARQEKQAIKNKADENKYSCVIQFGLHVPTEVIKAKSFPLTYDLFTKRKCQIFEPLDGVLKSGSKVTIHCRIPGAYCARLLLDGNWLSEDLIKDGIFKRQITVPRKKIIMYVKFLDTRNSSSYSGLFCYSVK